jgi:hypothetical protein
MVWSNGLKKWLHFIHVAIVEPLILLMTYNAGNADLHQVVILLLCMVIEFFPTLKNNVSVTATSYLIIKNQYLEIFI